MTRAPCGGARRQLLLLLLSLAIRPALAGAGEVVVATHLAADGRSGAYALFEPPDLRAGESRGALLFFHADGGAGTFEEWTSPELRALASRHGLVLVSLREPDGGCWWAPHARADALYVADFLEHVLVARYRIDLRRVYLAGKSGGAFFAAGVPTHAGLRFGGGVIGLCGGDVPRLDGGDCETEADAPQAPETTGESADLRFWFASTADEYVDYSLDAAQWFARRGHDVAWRPLAGVEHCGFDMIAELARALAEIDR